MNRIKALVVDDESSVCRAVRAILESEGISVRDTLSSLEAFELIMREKLDLIVSDLKMPEMSGIELSRKFKIIYPGIKILLVSGYTDDMSVASGLDKSQGFLQKPFTEDILAQKLRDLLD